MNNMSAKEAAIARMESATARTVRHKYERQYWKLNGRVRRSAQDVYNLMIRSMWDGVSRKITEQLREEFES